MTAATEPFKPWVNEARIDVRRDGSYRLARAGKLAKVVGVIDRDGELADFVAWFEDDPTEWWLRHNMHPILGAQALAIAQFHHKTIELQPNPDSWLNAAENHWRQLVEGRFPRSPHNKFVVLNWGADLRECIEGVGTITCSGSTLQKRFRQALRKWEPRVSVARPKMKHAA